MSKWTKLYQQLRRNASMVIAFRDFVKLIEAFGFEHKRSRGSHRSYRHPKIPEVVTIQPLGKDAARYQVDDFLEMVEMFDLHMGE